MKGLLRSLASQKRIAGGAAVLAFTQLISSGCGFLRDRAFSDVFPLDSDSIGVASVYIAAFRPSDLLFQLFVMSCLSVVLVPFLASHLAHGRRDEMNRITTSTLIVFGCVFGILALILALLFPMLAPHLVKFQGESLALYVRFGRIALLTNFLFVFGNTLGQYLITIQRYWVYGLTPILWAIGTIGGTYLLTPHLGAMGPIAGTVIGTVVYTLVRLFGVFKSGFRFSLGKEGVLHGELKQMGFLILPRMVALGALQLQLLLLDRLASGLATGTVAINQFASNFESVIPGIVGISVAQSAFSLLSQSAAKNDRCTMKRLIFHGIVFNLVLAIPGAVALAVLARTAGWLLHLKNSVSSTFVSALWIYCLAVPFESTNHIVLRSFYALKNTMFPALSSIASCAVAVVSGTMLLPLYGVYALAIAYVVAQATQTLLLGSSLLYALRSSRNHGTMAASS